MNNIKMRVEKLLSDRGISNHKAAKRFKSDFYAYLISTSHEMYPGGTCAQVEEHAEEVINILSNDDNLAHNSIFNENFRLKLEDIIPPTLKNNKVFMKMFPILVGNKGKGVGEGELILPLIIKDYHFSNLSDGTRYCPKDKKQKVTEIKKDGASLKPVKGGLTKKGLIDDLNNKYFRGNPPGKISKKHFEKHFVSISSPEDYRLYFQELYPECDEENLKALCQEVIDNNAYKDLLRFNNAVGKFVLKEYQRIDNWDNILFIDIEKENIIINICDTANIDHLNIEFKPVMKRGRDTQAIPDGYVNVKIKKC